MNRCRHCRRHAVPTTARLCSDCTFIYEVTFASAVIIVVGMFLIAIIGG